MSIPKFQYQPGEGFSLASPLGSRLEVQTLEPAGPKFRLGHCHLLAVHQGIIQSLSEAQFLVYEQAATYCVEQLTGLNCKYLN